MRSYFPFGLKENNFSQKNCQNQLIHPGLSHRKQEYKESLIQGKIHNQQNSNNDLEWFVKLSFRALWDSRLPGLHAFDMATIHYI